MTWILYRGTIEWYVYTKHVCIDMLKIRVNMRFSPINSGIYRGIYHISYFHIFPRFPPFSKFRRRNLQYTLFCLLAAPSELHTSTHTSPYNIYNTSIHVKPVTIVNNNNPLKAYSVFSPPSSPVADNSFPVPVTVNSITAI